MFFKKIKYALKMLFHKFDGRHNNCPSCQNEKYFIINDKAFYKFPTQLRQCVNCLLFYRHPITTATESKRYYELEYTQPGLTTDLPNDEQINALIKANFKDSIKDFSHWFNLFEKIAQHKNKKLRILDYGANWGYTVFQLSNLSFVEEVVGYEYSDIRSKFGKEKLNINYIKESEFSNDFDVVFSSHVIEHMYDPAIIKRHFDELLNNDGICIITCPNGSLSRIMSNINGFRQHWGMPHPNLISDKYLQKLFADYSGVISSDVDPSNLYDIFKSNDSMILSDLPVDRHLLAIMSKAKKIYA